MVDEDACYRAAAQLPRENLPVSDDPSPGLTDALNARDFFRSALRRLAAQDRQLLLMYYADGLTLREIGCVLGISESAACLRQKALSAELRRTVRTNLTDQEARRRSVMVTQTEVLKGLQILVVDDSPNITSLVGEILVDQGASVVPANSGTAAISLILLMKFDLVILDLGMPQPDGLKVIEFLRAIAPGLLRRTLVLTGMKFDRAAMALLERLRIPRLLKPFQIEELIHAASAMALPGSATRPAA